MSENITNNPSVPTQVISEVKFPRFINNLGIIPTSYKDSMSYYETLAWLCKYLEETVLPTVNQNGSAVQELQGLYIQLNDYVTHYFDNLDVQEEINQKLDNMVESGELQSLINNIFVTLQNQINALASGSPIVVSSVSQMTDTSKVYLNTSDGYWYYYNGNTWTSGGIYQSTGISSTNDQIKGINTKSSMLPYNYGYESANKPENMENGNIQSSIGTEIIFADNTARVRTAQANPYTQGEYFFYSSNSSLYKFYVIVTDENNICVSSYGWVSQRKMIVGEGQKGYLLIKKENGANITPAEATENVRLLTGAINYNIPKLICRNPIEINTPNRTVTIKSGSIIFTPFMGNYTLSNDIVLTYANANDLLYKLVFDLDNKTIKMPENTQSISYHYILLGYLCLSIGRVNYFGVNAPYIINGDIRYPHSTHFNFTDFEICNIAPGASGIDVNSMSPTRVSTTKYINFDGKIKIINKNPSVYRFAYRIFSKNNDTYTQVFDSGWITNEIRTIDVKNNYTVPIFSKIDNGLITAQEVLENFKIIPVYNLEKYSLINPRISNFHSVGHQGCIDSSHRGNSRSAFIYASMNGRTDIECDLKVTSDNVIVLSHDESITDDNNQTITISQVTYNQLLTHTFSGETIATFEEYLQICKKYGVNAYIDHIQYVMPNETTKNEMIRLIRKYRMDKRITFLSGTSYWNTLLTAFPFARLLTTFGVENPVTAENINDILAYKTNTNEVGFDLNYGVHYNSNTLNLFDNYSDVQLEFWTVDILDIYKEIMQVSNGVTSNTFTAYDCLT